MHTRADYDCTTSAAFQAPSCAPANATQCSANPTEYDGMYGAGPPPPLPISSSPDVSALQELKAALLAATNMQQVRVARLRRAHPEREGDLGPRRRAWSNVCLCSAHMYMSLARAAPVLNTPHGLRLPPTSPRAAAAAACLIAPPPPWHPPPCRRRRNCPPSLALCLPLPPGRGQPGAEQLVGVARPLRPTALLHPVPPAQHDLRRRLQRHRHLQLLQCRMRRRTRDGALPGCVHDDACRTTGITGSALHPHAPCLS